MLYQFHHPGIKNLPGNRFASYGYSGWVPLWEVHHPFPERSGRTLIEIYAKRTTE